MASLAAEFKEAIIQARRDLEQTPYAQTVRESKIKLRDCPQAVRLRLLDGIETQAIAENSNLSAFGLITGMFGSAVTVLPASDLLISPSSSPEEVTIKTVGSFVAVLAPFVIGSISGLISGSLAKKRFLEANHYLISPTTKNEA